VADYDLTYLSLGAGVQSSALLVCSALGLHGVPKADVAIFADTGDEPQYVYDYLDKLAVWCAEHSIPDMPILRVQKAVLSEWTRERIREGKRFVSLPVYTASDDGREGMLRRQCTREFKLAPIHSEVRRLIGVGKGQRVGKRRVRALLGISVDEAVRMKPSRERWIENSFPLVDAGIGREQCKRIVVQAGLPEPQKSACVYCPYHNDAEWQRLKTQHPADFARAVRFDRDIRDMSMRGVTQEVFVHRSCKPLDEVEFDPHGAAGQGDLFGNECEGMCGV
jgi:hypothetical protein